MRSADQETANQIGADTALDLAVERERLTRLIEAETQAVKLSTGTTKELDSMRSQLLQELAKSAPVIDYGSKLNDEQAAVIESLKRQREAADTVADASEKQADEITKQTTGIRDSGEQTKQTFKKISKQQTIAGNLANKAMRSISTFIGSQVDSLLDQIPLANEVKAAGSFVKSVIPKKKEEPTKRILPRSKAMEAQPATTAPETAQAAPESHSGMLKRRDEQGIGRVQRQQLAQLKHISKTTDSILKEVKDGFLAGMLTKVLMMAAFSGLAKLLLALPGAFAAKLLPKGIPNGFKPGAKTPDPKPKAEPAKKTDPKPKDPKKADPKPTDSKKADPKKPEPAKTEPKQTDPKKADSKPQPKAEPGKPNKAPAPEPAKPTKIPEVKPQPQITKAPAKGGGILDKGKDLLSKGAKGAGKLAKGIPWLGTILFGLDVVQQQVEDPRNVGLGHARAIMDGNQDSYTGDYQGRPDPGMERGEPPIAAEGEKLDQAAQAKTAEEKKADRKQQALMAMYASKTASNTTVINNSTTVAGSNGNEIPAFGHEYQTPHQKGTMIQR
ncbi:hypothetical protein CF111_10630 [Aeromonas sobria]|uniref:hypothetical protein n=1 Tax=Aeromonas sobria TaxID=646 RepID=UPI00111A4786|nr:hypothetical protein [Aeromonas sobria]TNJ22752.1 hypothetical protein CF111_10630 [Aeromonas sobria]